MGQSPTVPSHLSDEGKDFLASTFVHSPEERAEAQVLGHINEIWCPNIKCLMLNIWHLMFELQDLLNHNFVKIECEEENPSLPLFASITDFSEMRRTLVRRDSGKYWNLILILILMWYWYCLDHQSQEKRKILVRKYCASDICTLGISCSAKVCFARMPLLQVAFEQQSALWEPEGATGKSFDERSLFCI